MCSGMSSRPIGRGSQTYLGTVAAAAQRIDSGSTAAAEYHYRLLQLAQRAKDEAAAERAAQWIVENATGSPYELPALVVAARQADRAAEAASATDRRQAHRRGRRGLYPPGGAAGRFAGRSGQHAKTRSLRPPGWPSMMRAWVAAKEAAARLDRVLEALPDDRGYLRRAGAGALPGGGPCRPRWRVGESCWAGLSQGTDEWLEAKYYQIACLLKTDRPAAEKVWRAIQAAVPRGEIAPPGGTSSPSWRRVLSRELKQDNGGNDAGKEH